MKQLILALALALGLGFGIACEDSGTQDVANAAEDAGDVSDRDGADSNAGPGSRIATCQLDTDCTGIGDVCMNGECGPDIAPCDPGTCPAPTVCYLKLKSICPGCANETGCVPPGWCNGSDSDACEPSPSP